MQEVLLTSNIESVARKVDPTMLCIFCLTQKASSAEHVVPRALGGILVIQRVCQECNSLLGNRADQGLIDFHALMERRATLGLKSTNGKIPSPLTNALRYPIPTNTPGVSVRIKRTPENTYAAKVENYCEIEVTTHKTGLQLIQIKHFIAPDSDLATLEMMLKSALRKKGVLNEITLQMECDRFLPTLDLHQGPTEIDVPIRKRIGGYELGLVKIAYEMAHYWLGDNWLDDDIAKRLREGLLWNDQSKGKFEISKAKAIDRPRPTTDADARFNELPLAFNPSESHIMLLMHDQKFISVYIWILDVFAAKYVISEHADRYQIPEKGAVVLAVDEKRVYEFSVIQGRH